MTLEAIIFDLDGTIVDTETPDFQAWQTIYQAYGLDLSVELWKERAGKVVFEGAPEIFDPVAHFEQITGIRLDPAVSKQQYEHYIDLCKQQPILPGVLNIMQQAKLHHIKLAVASNSDRAWVDYWLGYYDLHQYFQCVYTRDDVVNPKPAPDIYLSAVRCLNVPVERCIAIEDSSIGIEAANAAGVRCIAVPNWLTDRLDRPDSALTLRSLADIDFAALLSRF
jgi:putative hydrolase of the HAD superfamily